MILHVLGSRYPRCFCALGIGFLGLGCGEAAPSAAPIASPQANPSAAPPSPPATGRPAAVPSASAPLPPAPTATHEHADDEAGGECVGSTYPGTCAGTADGTFTFRGVVEGKPVTLSGNTFYGKASAGRLAPGKEQPCHLKLSTSGTCTPCTLSLGSCGEPALDLFRRRL